MNQKYQDYLRSPAWHKVRRAKLKEVGGKCEKCGWNRGIRIHHKTYDNVFNELEHLEDLEALCGICHDKHHGIPLDDSLKNNHRSRQKYHPRHWDLHTENPRKKRKRKKFKGSNTPFGEVWQTRMRRA